MWVRWTAPPRQVECKPIGDPGATGNFEVTLNGVLIHSKKTMGHGKCTYKEETDRVINAVAVRPATCFRIAVDLFRARVLSKASQTNVMSHRSSIKRWRYRCRSPWVVRRQRLAPKRRTARLSVASTKVVG